MKPYPLSASAPMPPLIKRSKQEEIAFNLRPKGLITHIHLALDGRSSAEWIHGLLHPHLYAHAICF